MASQSKRSSDHVEIRTWIEERGGRPATVAGTKGKREEAGLLRIDFPGGASNPPLEPISWEDFFKKFDKENLELIFQEETSAGKKSYFCKFVERETSGAK